MPPSGERGGTSAITGLRPLAPSRARIEIRGVRLWFGASMVLDGVDLDVRRGENLVLIGMSGSGKTVLLRCILGLLQPDMGIDPD